MEGFFLRKKNFDLEIESKSRPIRITLVKYILTGNINNTFVIFEIDSMNIDKVLYKFHKCKLLDL